MTTLMSSKVGESSELFAARFALEWFLPCMSHLVASEVIMQSKLLVALIAFVRLRAGMGELMPGHAHFRCPKLF
jgi:hypothetical protein